MSGGLCADFVFDLVGMPLDADKAENDMVSMVLLGARAFSAAVRCLGVIPVCFFLLESISGLAK